MKPVVSENKSIRDLNLLGAPPKPVNVKKPKRKLRVASYLVVQVF